MTVAVITAAGITTDVITAAFVVQTVTLSVVTVALAYPVVAYSQNVAHTYGVVLMSIAFGLMTVSFVLTGFVGYSWTVQVVILAASLFALAATWSFARPFLRFVDDETGTFDEEWPT